MTFDPNSEARKFTAGSKRCAAGKQYAIEKLRRTYFIHSTNTGNGWSYCFTNLTIHETAHGEIRRRRRKWIFIHKVFVSFDFFLLLLSSLVLQLRKNNLFVKCASRAQHWSSAAGEESGAKCLWHIITLGIHSKRLSCDESTLRNLNFKHFWRRFSLELVKMLPTKGGLARWADAKADSKIFPVLDTYSNQILALLAARLGACSPSPIVNSVTLPAIANSFDFGSPARLN